MATAVQAAWTAKRVHNGIVYFGNASPARIERFDLSTETWLDPLTVSVSPNVLFVDDTGVYVGNQREVRKLGLDGSGEAPVFNATFDVAHLEGDGTFLFVMHPGSSYGRISSLRVSDYQLVDTWSGVYEFTSGFTIDPVQKVLYGVNTYTTAYNAGALRYNNDGTFGTYASGVWGNGSFGAAALYLSPDRRILVRNTGAVYAAPSLQDRGSLAGAVQDVVFQGDITVILREGRLIAFNAGFLSAGVHQIDGGAEAIVSSGDQIYAFVTDLAQDSGIAVQKIAFSDITAAQPGDPLDPALVAITPDQVVAAGDDTFFILDKSKQSVFRWSATTLAYTQSLPLLDAPQAIAYSADANRLYVGYTGGEINQIKFDEDKTVEEPFAIRPGRVLGLQVAGNLVFTVDDSGAWETFSTYDLAGNVLSTREWSNYSTEYIWAPSMRRMFYFRDGTSPNDLLYTEIATDGTLADDKDSPYHGDYSIRHPIRVSDDASGVLLGSGIIFSSTDLTVVASLSNTITDAVSRNNRWVTIREAGNASQIQTWNQNNLFDQGVTVPGAPNRLFELNDGRLLVMNEVGNRIVFSIVDLDNGGTVQSGPSVPSITGTTTGYVGVPFKLTVNAQGSGDLTYQWFKNSAPIEGETTAVLSIAEPTLDDVGIYMVVVSNAFGSVASDSYSLTFSELPAPPVFTTQPGNYTIRVGDYFSGFYVYVNGSVTYQWRRDGEVIPGATNYSYNPTTGNQVSAADYGVYDVVVTDTFGRSVTSTSGSLLEPTRTLGYSLMAYVPSSGLTVTMVLRGSGEPLVVRASTAGLSSSLADTALSDPFLSIYDQGGQLVGLNDNWSTAANASDLNAASETLGLPALMEGSADAALYRSMSPGSYTFHVEGADGGTGWVLFEIYDAAGNGSADRFPYLAALGQVKTGQSMALGVVHNNAGRVPMLLRGWGPATGRSGAAPDVAVVWGTNDTVLRSNDDWSDGADASSIASFVNSRGLHAFGANGSDAALMTPAVHTTPTHFAELLSMNGSDGAGLLELVQTDAFPSYSGSIPPLVLVGPEPIQAVVGEDVILSSRGTSGSSNYYSWSRDGIPIAGAIGRTVILRNVDSDDVGNYAVTVGNPGASFTSMPVALNVVSEAVNEAVSAHHSATSFVPGGNATITVEMNFPAETASLGWMVELPSGWSYVSGVGEPSIAPVAGATGVLEWAWTEVPTSPATFTFDIRSPSNHNDIASLSAFEFVQIDGRLTARLADPNPLILRPGSGFHRADTNFDGRIGLSELLRVIELYNYREGPVRTGRYSSDGDTADGVRPGSGGGPLVLYHSADYDRDGKVDLSELLRVIQIYNYRSGANRTGQYRATSGTVDGFLPGP